jgi:hypothetical protein
MLIGVKDKRGQARLPHRESLYLAELFSNLECLSRQFSNSSQSAQGGEGGLAPANLH